MGRLGIRAARPFSFPSPWILRTSAATVFKSSKNCSRARSRISGSGMRSSDDGWTVARRADERPARLVLLVAGLLADEHDRRLPRALAEDRLRGVAVEVAPAATVRRLP